VQKRTEDSLPTSFFVQRESLFVDDTGHATLHKSTNTATDAMDHGPGTSIHNRSSGRCRPATAGGRPGQGRGRRKRQKSTSEDPRLLRAGLVLCMNHPSSPQAGAARHRHPPWRPMSAPYVKRVDRWKQFTAAGVSEQVQASTVQVLGLLCSPVCRRESFSLESQDCDGSNNIDSSLMCPPTRTRTGWPTADEQTHPRLQIRRPLCSVR
jgi:hypothetical protein